MLRTVFCLLKKKSNDAKSPGESPDLFVFIFFFERTPFSWLKRSSGDPSFDLLKINQENLFRIVPVPLEWPNWAAMTSNALLSHFSSAKEHDIIIFSCKWMFCQLFFFFFWEPESFLCNFTRVYLARQLQHQVIWEVELINFLTKQKRSLLQV